MLVHVLEISFIWQFVWKFDLMENTLFSLLLILFMYISHNVIIARPNGGLFR